VNRRQLGALNYRSLARSDRGTLREHIMRTTALIAAAGLLSMATASWAAENSGTAAGSGNTPRMQGSPNAAGFGKAETTGTAGSQTPDTTPSQDGKMKGPPNASGFQQDKSGSGSTTSGATSGR
jgi:hypothetical protein